MSDTSQSLIILLNVEYDTTRAEIVLHVGGARIPTGIQAPTAVAAVRMLVDRLAGTAPP